MTESIKEVEVEVAAKNCPEEIKILRAARRWTSTQTSNQEEEADGACTNNNSNKNDAPPRPVFVLSSKFKAATIGDAGEVKEEAKKKPFTFSFSSAAMAKPENNET